MSEIYTFLKKHADTSDISKYDRLKATSNLIDIKHNSA